MTRLRTIAAAGVCLMLLVASACTDKKADTQAKGTTSPTPTASPVKISPFPVDFNPSEFGPDSATITNAWWPLKPGTRWTWEGQATDGEDRIARKIVFTVTDLVKEIAGVRTLVGWDRDFNDGVLAESELIFLAQDKAGNVRHFGQYAELWDPDEPGKLDGGSAWLVGYLEGAKTGILMPANPQVGTPTYSEGFAPAPFFWDDVARVAQAGQKTCVKAGCYTDVVVIEESEPTKPDAFQLKYWVRGVGNVRTGWRGKNEIERETLELVKVEQLSQEELAAARAEAMKLESRAQLYGLTAPSTQRTEATEPTTSPTGSPTA